MQGLTRLLEHLGYNVANGSLAVTPVAERVDAASNQDKTAVFDEFVVDCLGGDIFTLEVTVLDSLSDIRKVHWLTGIGQDNVNFITNIFWINGRPLS